MEPGEEVTEAAIREVKEETGLDFEPSTLLSVEAAGMFYELSVLFRILPHVSENYYSKI